MPFEIKVFAPFSTKESPSLVAVVEIALRGAADDRLHRVHARHALDDHREAALVVLAPVEGPVEIVAIADDFRPRG